MKFNLDQSNKKLIYEIINQFNCKNGLINLIS